MTREEFIKQRCEIDKITEEEFEKQYRVVKCDCGQPYCKGYRCLDLDGLLRDNQELREKLDKYENPEDMTLMMMWCTEKVKDENQALNKQLEENKDNYNCLLKQKEQFEYIMSKQVDYQGQQKEFKKYLEDEIKDTEKTIELLSDTRSSRIPILQYKKHIIEVILAKYKEIIGGNKDEK